MILLMSCHVDFLLEKLYNTIIQVILSKRSMDSVWRFFKITGNEQVGCNYNKNYTYRLP